METALIGKIKDVDIDTLTQGFTVHRGLANMLKFGLLGAYIQGDEDKIKLLESKFLKSGDLYDYRAYKSEAKKVFNYVKTNGSLKADKVYNMADLGNLEFGEMPFSLGVIAKGLPSKESKPNPMKEQNKIINKAIENLDITKAQFVNAMAGLLGEDAQETAKQEYSLAESELQNQAIGEQVSKVMETIPAYNLDRQAFMETLKSMIKQIHSFEGDLSEVTDFIMELQTNSDEVELVQAA